MEETKAAISIADMARMVGLSRARFYQLMGTTFPWPVYSLSTRRPFYDEILQNSCLEVRRRNCGIDGKAILFYAKRIGTSAPVRKPRPVTLSSPSSSKVDAGYGDLLDGLRSLGLMTATMPQVAAAVKELFPEGVQNLGRGQVLRAVFLRLKRQDTGDSVVR
ncbi:MAG: hypothetical protein ABSG53_28625 [Thermoguttaceae bacterium]